MTHPDRRPECLDYADVSYPKCVHRWDAPESCPSCLAIYKQRCIEKAEAAHAALEAEVARLREALEEIAGATEPGTPMWIAMRARAALAEAEEVR